MPELNLTPHEPGACDENLIAVLEQLLAAALTGHSFGLSVQCDTCGEWVRNLKSVRRRRCPLCTRRARQVGAA